MKEISFILFDLHQYPTATPPIECYTIGCFHIMSQNDLECWKYTGIFFFFFNSLQLFLKDFRKNAGAWGMIHRYLLFPLIHSHMPMQGWTLSRLPPISMATGTTEQNFDIQLLYKQHPSASYGTLWNRKKRKIYFHAGKRYRHAEVDWYTGLNILHNFYN